MARRAGPRAAKFGAILSGAGYASDANFTAGCEGDLHVAVTREPAMIMASAVLTMSRKPG